MEKYELKENNTYYYKHHLYVVINIGRQKMEMEHGKIALSINVRMLYRSIRAKDVRKSDR